MSNLSNIIIPLMVLFIVIYGFYKKVNIYDEFLKGASESFKMIAKIFPNLLAMMLSINIFLKSGVLDLIYNLLRPLFNLIKIPIEILPMIIMRPISGTST